MKPTNKKQTDYSVLMLRLGLAIVFLYAGFDAFREPDAWISYVPHFTTHFVSAKLSLDVISVVQLAVGALLIVGRYVRYAAILGALLIGGIVIFNLNTLLITFRDIGLFFMALALYFAAPVEKWSK